MMRLTLAFMVLALSAGTAAAQDRQVADRVHDPLTMDRFTPVSTFNFDLGYEVLDDDESFIDTVFALTAAGHFVSDSGAGGYVVLPLSFISTEDDPLFGEGESDAILGNLEVGGLYAMPLGRDADLIMHGGVALPTANDDLEAGELDLLQPIASVPRMGDLVDRWPNSTWLRLGVSPMGRASMFFWRADVGLDLMIDDDDGAGADISPLVRVNIGGGFDLGGVDLMAELVTNISADDDDTAGDEGDSATTLAFGGRFGRGNVQPGLAVLLPIDLDGYEALDMAIIASIAARMP